MNVEYSRRALADLATIAADSRAAFGGDVTIALERRFRETIDRIAREPESAPPVTKRPGVHVVALVRYPFKLFYRIVSADRIRVLHIRHTSRSQWKGEGL